MKTRFFLTLLALSGMGGGSAWCQQDNKPVDGAPVAAMAATPGQESEIRKLIGELVISEKETQVRSDEQARSQEVAPASESDKNPSPDPFAPGRTLSEVDALLKGYSETRQNAVRKLTAFEDLAFPLLMAHLDDERPSSALWGGHIFARTVGKVCYQIIHLQLTDTPGDYSEYGYQRTGRDGNDHVKPYWKDSPYDEAGGLGKWLQQNAGLSLTEKRIKCLAWQLEKERKIGVIDPHGYYANIQPLEREILELKAAAGQDVGKELSRAREISKNRPASQVPKELLPDGPLPEIEHQHALQETSAMLKSCPDGHTTLKDIPILYVATAVLTKKPAEWSDEDRALAKRRDSGEIILGGEPDSARDPRFQVSCGTCGYHYKVLAVPDVGGNWFKKGRRFTDFTKPFSKAARSLPFAGMEGADFEMEVNKLGLVVAESIKLTLPASRKNELVKEIGKWIDANGFERPLLHLETPPFPRLFEQPLEDGVARFHIEVRTDATKGETGFHFNLERSDENPL